MSNKNMGSKKFKLEDFKKSQVFTVSENYFEALPEKIQARVAANQKYSFYTIFHFNKKVWYAYACSILLLLGLGIYIIQYQDKDVAESANNSLASISNDEIIDYLVYNHSNDYDIIKIAENRANPLPTIQLEKMHVDEELIFENIDYNEVEDLTKEL